MASICTAPVYKMEALNNLFIELTAKNCNQRCNCCFIKFPMSKMVKDFIPEEKIREALEDTKNENLYCIYLTGAEPMTHPDFNSILRTCLKRCNVSICTNGSFLNEKKIRFLSKVEGEGNNQIFFQLSLTHFNEQENDRAKYRGNFRQTIFALKTLSRYNFNSVLTVQNFYSLDKTEIENNFNRIFNEQQISNTDIKVINSYNGEEMNDISVAGNTDCMHGRCLSNDGIYACPFLAGDFRGRVGSSFKNFSDSFRAETNFCSVCGKNSGKMFSIG